MNFLKWHGENDTLEVGPFKLKRPLVYGTTSNFCDEPSAINAAWPIQPPQSEDDSLEEEDDYIFYGWTYAELAPVWRWRYLEWIGQGRPKTTNMLFLMLFLQGLERRLIIDESDPVPIWDELWRLYPDTNAGYSLIHATIERLLWCLLLPVDKHAQESQVIRLAQMEGRFLRGDDEAEKRLSMLVGWSMMRLGRLPAWLAYHCARSLSNTRPGVVFERAQAEMQQLFTACIERWDEARLQMRLTSKKFCSWEYDAFNETVPDVVVHWPDALAQHRQWKKLGKELVELFDQCQVALRPYAMILGKEGVTRESRLAWEALPAQLKQGEHPSRAHLLQLGGGQLQQTGYAATTVGQVAGVLEVAQRPSLTMPLSQGLVQSLHLCGLGVEPDAHLTGKPYRWDEPVVLFPTTEETSGLFVEGVGTRYQNYATFLRYAFFVARAAGEVHREALSLIAERLYQVFDLQPLEKRRARALAGLLLRQEIDLKGSRTPLQQQDKLREHLPPLLLEIVGLNGQVDKAEEAALAAVWKRLGLEKRQLTQELDSLSARGVVFVGNTVAGRSGEKLPPPPPEASLTMAFELDHAAIGALLEDTAHVHRALHEAMNVEEAGSQNAEVEAPGAGHEALGVEQEAPANGLPPQLNALLTELLQQEQWPKEAAGELARRHGTMLAGAVEKINDWAFEEWGEQLIYDDGDVLSVERELVGNR